MQNLKSFAAPRRDDLPIEMLRYKVEAIQFPRLEAGLLQGAGRVDPGAGGCVVPPDAPLPSASLPQETAGASEPLRGFSISRNTPTS